MDIPYEYLLIVVAWLMLFVGFYIEEMYILMLTAIFMLCLGVFIIINGVNSVDNFATQAFGIFHLGISFYVLLRANTEVFGKW
jgi:hypothetical protein|tara:strand:- start:428 stop:676 length:249 start_codon:yes stop_codon:yes gene_type:complete